MASSKPTIHTKKKVTKKNANKSVLFPLLLVVFVIIAVILIIIFTQGAKPESTAAKATPPVEVTASNELPVLISTKQYSSGPPMLINTTKKYTATIKMASGGEFVIELYPDKAPMTVNSFVFLAREGFFDGVTFHRVLDGFMAQGGDPTGTGMGGPGYEFAYEGSDLAFDKAGVVAMANSGPATATNGSQFFITFVPVQQLNGGYTIFGQVTSGMDVVDALTRRDPERSPDFTGDAIETVTITEK